MRIGTGVAGTGTADGDREGFACGEPEGAADFCAEASGVGAWAAAALRAKGEDLIGVGGGDRKGDKTPGECEIERCGACGPPERSESQKPYSSQQKLFQFTSSLELPTGLIQLTCTLINIDV
jgi:hypothetical protein